MKSAIIPFTVLFSKINSRCYCTIAIVSVGADSIQMNNLKTKFKINHKIHPNNKPYKSTV